MVERAKRVGQATEVRRKGGVNNFKRPAPNDFHSSFSRHSFQPEPAVQDDAKTLRTVVVVEDEILLRLLVSDELRAAGFEVIEAASGEEAIGLLGIATKIDVVLTDIQLGGPIDGYAVAAEFRKRHPQIKVLIASGTAKLDATDVDATFIKPYNLHGIVARLNQLFSHPDDQRWLDHGCSVGNHFAG